MLYDRIIILDDSVVLKHHWINDEKWEQVMAFPRGGLTYLIQNNAIKFFLTNDYFYRNTVMSLELPLYIVDETMGIDGEYSDITELTEILDRIFPSANGEVDLTPYLKKVEAEELYQPIGDYLTEIPDNYVTDEDLDDVLEDYLTKDEAAETYQPIGNYLTEHQPLKTINGQTISGTGNIEIEAVDAYTKAESDARYQPKGNYALKSEIPSLDGYATETWVLNKGYVNQLKTINNISLIGTGNIEIGTGGTIDAYTKQEADERFQPKGNYVTESTLLQYITNLQTQITTIIESVSGCCSEPETIYRWITMTGENDYICSGTTKYAKEKKQVSTDNGMTWNDVVPAEYQRGIKLEDDSPDCGYEPTIEYRWVTVQNGYVCSGTTKYSQEKKQYRIDGGEWQDTNPLETRRGSTVIEAQSTDCGYIAPQYRWYQAPSTDYVCSGTSKYYKEYYQVSNDGGQTWQNVSPVQTRRGTLIETDSTDCGYIPTNYKLLLTSTDDTRTIINCNGVTTAQTSETHSGIDNTKIKEAIIGNCVDTLGYKLFSYCTSLSAVTIPNGVINIDNGAFYNCSSLSSVTIPSAVTSIGQEAFSGCASLTNVNIPNGVEDIKTLTFAYTNVENITIPDSVKTILNHSFDHCTNLKNINIGTGCTTISMAFTNCTGLQTVTVNALTPPMLLSKPFENTNDTFVIKVPASVLNTYKTASGWSTYASRIEAI